jgi:uncharacterized protein
MTAGQPTPGIVIRAAHFPGRAPVDSYGNGGFRFAGMSHRGSLLCLPSGIHGWDAVSPDALYESALARVFAEADAIDTLLVGTGPKLVPIPPALLKRLREVRIVAEAMSTGAAVRTFNVLLAEDRAVAAALVAVD